MQMSNIGVDVRSFGNKLFKYSGAHFVPSPALINQSNWWPCQQWQALLITKLSIAGIKLLLNEKFSNIPF